MHCNIKKLTLKMLLKKKNKIKLPQFIQKIIVIWKVN